MHFADADRLLDPRPMPLEMGWQRQNNGVLHVAIRTDMHGCTGAMLEWWFGSRMGTREYRWWHPIDHIASNWVEGAAGSPVGAIHQAEERFTERPAEQLSIQFRDPAEAFDAGALAAARAGGAVSAAILAHGGPGFDPRRRPDGAVIGTRLIHLGRDTPWGMVLRTRFFLGHDLPQVGMPPAEIARIFPDEQAPALLQHCYDEFTYLSRILPSLYLAEGPEDVAVTRPW
ncbi:DAPG hydrolase family protein [Sphingomonas sp.]|uniref:DAPG hydrolase family protein n=1 Tax=Sphingomonas sp. TaxID=28214 RepID=UPI003CC56D16